MACGFVYILCNRKNGALFIGFTKDLGARLEEHKSFANPKSHTAKYGITRLVYFERYEMVVEAMKREKQLKEWNRSWKIALIERDNPEWRELALDWRDLE